MEFVHIRHDGIEGTPLVPVSSLAHYTGHGWVVVPEEDLTRPTEYVTPKAVVSPASVSPPTPVEANRKTAGRGNAKEK